MYGDRYQNQAGGYTNGDLHNYTERSNRFHHLHRALVWAIGLLSLVTLGILAWKERYLTNTAFTGDYNRRLHYFLFVAVFTFVTFFAHFFFNVLITLVWAVLMLILWVVASSLWQSTFDDSVDCGILGRNCAYVDAIKGLGWAEVALLTILLLSLAHYAITSRAVMREKLYHRYTDAGHHSGANALNDVGTPRTSHLGGGPVSTGQHHSAGIHNTNSTTTTGTGAHILGGNSTNQHHTGGGLASNLAARETGQHHSTATLGHHTNTATQLGTSQGPTSHVA